MLKNKNILPDLSIDLDFGQDVVAEKEDVLKSNKLTYEQFLLDQKNKKGISAQTSTPEITFRMLNVAPKDFFDKFKPAAKAVTSEIITSISSSDSAIHITNHRNNPTDNALKERILYIVASEFDKIDRSNELVSGMNNVDKDILLAMVIDEVIGLGPLEPLWRERKITEIMCNGPFDIQVEIDGVVNKVPSVSFRDKQHLKALIDKLYSSINKQLSPTIPRERGRLHDNSRMYAVHEVIAPKGPNFNIRKHSDDYWSAEDIIDRGTASAELMEDIGNYIHAGVSFLVVGGTGTGKTTFLNSLTGFFDDNHRIVTLEENLEMKPHPGKLIAAPMECVPARSGEGKEFGVTMRDLVRSSLQMRPDCILIGEVSDGAAYDLCQALNTGHQGGSTVHANDANDALNRLSSLVSQEEFVRGPAVLDLIGSAFDIIMVVDRMGDGSRKVVEVVEVGREPILASNGQLRLAINPLWNFEPLEIVDENGDSKIGAKWTKVNELSEYRQNKHRLHLKRRLPWEELVKISRYDGKGGN